MPWVRLSDDWYDDDELIEAGPAAMLLWPLLISWSARNLKDGKIPAGQIPRLVDWHTLRVEPEQAIAPLVASGRLQEIAGGYLIVNFLKYQPSREKVLADRDASKARAAKSRDRHKGGAEVVREACADGADPPDPVPDPPSSSSSSSDLDRLPADLWTTIADKKLKTAKIRTSASGFRKKVIENDRKDGDLIARALSLLEMFDLTTSHLAECLVSGNNPPNAYRRKATA